MRLDEHKRAFARIPEPPASPGHELVVTDRHKLAVNLLSDDELYDLEEDPDEMVNLINSEEHAGIRNELHDRILDWMNDTRDPFRGYYWERRPWRTRTRLGWRGPHRPRAADGYAPDVRDYDTGLPTRGVKLEYR